MCYECGILKCERCFGLTGEDCPCWYPTQASQDVRDHDERSEFSNRATEGDADVSSLPEVESIEPDLKWYERKAEKREAIAKEIRADAGETDFNIADSLRLSWNPLQRADKDLASHMKVPGSDFRLAPDGCLERRVEQPLSPATWVIVVPEGDMGRGMPWKKWVFLQCHVGVLGAHRNADKTQKIIQRICWWSSMKLSLIHISEPTRPY